MEKSAALLFLWGVFNMNDQMVLIDGEEVSLSVSADDFEPKELIKRLSNLFGDCRTDEILRALAEYEWALNELRKDAK